MADREGDKAQGSIRHIVATDGPPLDATPDSLLACLAKGKQGFWLDVRLILGSFWITFRGKWEHSGAKI